MSNYIGVVPVTFDEKGEGKVYLYECRPWSVIKVGSYVMVAVGKIARVCAHARTIDKDGEEYEWLLKVLGGRNPLTRIVGRFEPVEYESSEDTPF